MYNKHKSIVKNRHDFKDFFSYLTNIRCAVIEGSHRVEGACQVLQEYKLGDPIPLQYHKLNLPPSSTLFKNITTHVYHCNNAGQKLNDTVFDYLKEKSKTVAHQKELIVTETWHLFFSRVLEDISKDTKLMQTLFEIQDEFYHEEVNYEHIGKEHIQSNIIKMHLHEILTNAIFEYCPCKNLLNLCKMVNKPEPKDWKKCAKAWRRLSSVPYQVVSQSIGN